MRAFSPIYVVWTRKGQNSTATMKGTYPVHVLEEHTFLKVKVKIVTAVSITTANLIIQIYTIQNEEPGSMTFHTQLTLNIVFQVLENTTSKMNLNFCQKHKPD